MIVKIMISSIRKFCSIYLRTVLWHFLTCRFRSPIVENNFWQMSHLSFFSPWWIFLIWRFNCTAVANDWSQNSHLWSLWPSWIVWRCFFKYGAPENDLPVTTRFTFVIFMAFMNCVDVFLQISCTIKWCYTRITLVFL